MNIELRVITTVIAIYLIEIYSYDNNKTTGLVTSNVNLRSQSTTKSKIVTKIPAYTSVSIISKKGAWYYVSVQKLNQNYNLVTYRGYIHSSLIH